MRQSKLTVIITSLLLTFSTAAIASQEAITFKDHLKKANDYIKSYRHFEASDALKEATQLGGAKHPSLHMRLGILYYGLGLIPKAIAEGEKAVALAPSSKWYKYDLAKFYYVDKSYDKAEQQFIALLKIDPGFTLGYYYLAELYTQKKSYDMAWLSLQRARMLGFQGKDLEARLAPMTTKPAEEFTQVSDDKKLFRFIKLPSSEKAQEVIAEIWEGKLFENLELELKKDKSSQTDFGVMMLSELMDTIAGSLQESEPFSSPVIVKTGPDYRIMQRIVPFDPAAWKSSIKSTPVKNQSKKKNIVASVDGMSNKPNQVNKASVTDQGDMSKKAPSGAATPKPMLSAKLAAFYVLENWQKTWEMQNVDAYLSNYSNNFIPADDISMDEWQKKRNKSLTRPKYISIDIKDPIVEMLADTQLLITFKQSYESDTYQDTVIKTLTMAKEEEGWKIMQEREIQNLTP